MSDDLVKRLSLLADSIELGDKLRWGEDSAALRDAKDHIEGLEAKLAHQNDLVQAAVAAKLREAAKEAKTYFIGAGGEDIAGREVRAGAEISRAILALITDDAQAALDRALEAERDRCAKIAENCADLADTNGDYLLICNVVAAIRKGGE